MHSDNITPSYATGIRIFICWLTIILLGGCATKPWTDPLTEDAFDSTAHLLDTIASRDNLCKKTLEADLALFFTSPLKKRALEGYFLFSPPKSFKFVVTNPFGQTTWAIAGNQSSYQILDPLQRRYTAGNLDSFGIRNEIPSFFLEGEWTDWLTGRNQYTSDMITSIKNDKQSRGVWITLKKNRSSEYINHILLNPEGKRILQRILTSETEKKLATITYVDYQEFGECLQPLSVDISGLGYGTEIRLKFGNVALLDELKTYKLPVPNGYSRRFLP